MYLKRILEGINYICEHDSNPKIDDIIYDSRNARPDVMFVCLSGARYDGHEFAANAYKNGCRCFMVEHPVDLPENCIQIIVENTRASLAVASVNFFRHPAKEMKIIGVTGTKGKTSTAHIIRALIEENGIKCGIIGTIGAFYGDVNIKTVNTTPESYELQRIFRAMADNGCKACVMEVSSISLMAHRVDCLEYDVGVFTNLSPDHIGTNEHPDFEDYMHWKSVMFERSKKAVVNIDDPAYENMLAASNAEVITYGVEQSDVRADDIRLIKTPRFIGVSFNCTDFGKTYRVEVSLPGYFNVHNTLAGIGVCDALGIDAHSHIDCLKEIRVSGRAECVYVSDDYDVIIDYAHNGLSMKSMLDTLKAYPHNRIIALYGSVGGRTRLRRKELGLVTGKECDLSILTSDDPEFEDPRDIIRDIAVYVEKAGGKYVGIPDRAEAIEYALNQMKSGDILLLAGKGHEQYMKIKGERVPFSEKECIEKLKKRRAR